MRKELRPQPDIACDICERTILKGERTETYLAPAGSGASCASCAPTAPSRGLDPRVGRRRARFARRARAAPRLRAAPGAATGRRGARREVADDAPPPSEEAYRRDAEPRARVVAPPPQPSSRPRHVRAVPTNAQVKVERALELFNALRAPAHDRGIARTLGEPWVSATPLTSRPAWSGSPWPGSCSWYRFAIDLRRARRCRRSAGRRAARADEQVVTPPGRARRRHLAAAE